ncbi:DUF6090 family protein [Bizionia sp.]|uniref:DUF6090 family protein n=1 Tax=Bizionia sp. TaxID=1954480 RepID=UPI003A9517F0
MIKLFRPFRQDLFRKGSFSGQGGKTARYFKYAIGEIILVVIGILIALSINNWNENRKHASAEQEFFKSIKNDLK